MTFQVGGVYTHKKLLDTKIFILDRRASYEEGHTDQRLRVLWMSQTTGMVIAVDQFMVNEKASEDWYAV